MKRLELLAYKMLQRLNGRTPTEIINFCSQESNKQFFISSFYLPGLLGSTMIVTVPCQSLDALTNTCSTGNII